MEPCKDLYLDLLKRSILDIVYDAEVHAYIAGYAINDRDEHDIIDKIKIIDCMSVYWQKTT